MKLYVGEYYEVPSRHFLFHLRRAVWTIPFCKTQACERASRVCLAKCSNWSENKRAEKKKSSREKRNSRLLSNKLFKEAL